MPRRLLAGWNASLRALGAAFGELMQAELSALGDDLSRSGRRLGGALLLLAAALFALFWGFGLLVYLAVEVAHLWLPRWAAAAVVLGVVLLVTALLAAIGRRRIQRTEWPAETLRRRWLSHREWWAGQFPVAEARDSRQSEAAIPAADEDEPTPEG